MVIIYVLYWIISGLYIDHVWMLYIYMYVERERDCIWILYGLYLCIDYVWIIFGLYRERERLYLDFICVTYLLHMNLK